MVAARDIVDQMVAVGAVITRPGTPLVRELVGALRWTGERELFWFTAFGEKPADGHLVAYDEIEIHSVGVCFVHGGAIAALLSTIEKAALDDPDDYRVAWRLWQEILPLREPLIRSVLDGLLQKRPEPATLTSAAMPMVQPTKSAGLMIDGFAYTPPAPAKTREPVRPAAPARRPRR